MSANANLIDEEQIKGWWDKATKATRAKLAREAGFTTSVEVISNLPWQSFHKVTQEGLLSTIRKAIEEENALEKYWDDKTQEVDKVTLLYNAHLDTWMCFRTWKNLPSQAKRKLQGEILRRIKDLHNKKQ